MKLQMTLPQLVHQILRLQTQPKMCLLLQPRNRSQPLPFEAERDWTPKRMGIGEKLLHQPGTQQQQLMQKKVRFTKVNFIGFLKMIFIFLAGKIPTRQSSLEAYLHANTITQIKDPALNCLHLLKVLYGLNNYWWELFDDNSQKQSRPIWHKALIPQRFIRRD